MRNHDLYVKDLLSIIKHALSAMILFGLLIAMPIHTVHADAQESVMSKLKKGVAVRDRKRLLAKRFELAVGSDFSVNDVYNRNILLGVNAHYYLKDYFALGAHVAYGLNSTTALADRIKAKRPQSITEKSFSGVGLLAGLDAVFIPAFGKFSLLGTFAARYDISLMAGVAMVQVSGDAFDSWSLAPNLGVASRFFLNDNSAISLQLKDYIYNRASNLIPIQQADGTIKTTKEETWSNQFFISISYNFFFGKPSTGK
jgi:outer membrane beta-barrel protein